MPHKSMVRSVHKKKLAPSTAKAVGKIVEKHIHANEENKYFDLSQVIAAGNIATNSAGSVVLISGVQQGQSFATRIGETLSPVKLELRFDCSAFQFAGSVPFDTNLRLIIFQDRQIRTSTLPTVVDILETVVYNSPLNHIGINAKRFNILVDKIFQMDPAQVVNTTTQALTIWTNQTSQRMTKMIKLRGKIVYTNATTGTERNNIYVMYLSDQITGQSPLVNLYSRLIFEDA